MWSSKLRNAFTAWNLIRGQKMRKNAGAFKFGQEFIDIICLDSGTMLCHQKVIFISYCDKNVF